MIEYLGIIGLLFLVIAWLPETIEMIKNKQAHLNRKFIVLYVIGSIFLAMYSYYINDLIFIVLNSFIALIAMLNGYYEFLKK